MDDLISRREAIRIASGYCHHANIAKELTALPSATPTIEHIRAKVKALYKDSENGAAGEYIRGWDAAIDEVTRVIDGYEEGEG